MPPFPPAWLSSALPCPIQFGPITFAIIVVIPASIPGEFKSRKLYTPLSQGNQKSKDRDNAKKKKKKGKFHFLSIGLGRGYFFPKEKITPGNARTPTSQA